MKALSCTHWCVEIMILWFDWGGYECEIWVMIDTCAWLIWAFTQVLWPMNAIQIRPSYFSSDIASLVICLRWCCSIFVVFIMNDLWLDVLDLLRSSAAGGLFGTFVSACWGIQSCGLTHLSHVLNLNQGFWSFLCDWLVLVVSSWFSCIDLSYVLNQQGIPRINARSFLTPSWSLQCLWLSVNRLPFFSFVWILTWFSPLALPSTLRFELDFSCIWILPFRKYGCFGWFFFVDSTSRLR